MKPSKMTPRAQALFEREALLRHQSLTNKQLAEITGFTPATVANIVARMRRRLESNSQLVNVSCETNDST
jgi:DNA-binding CsgD family transcriptional regulator